MVKLFGKIIMFQHHFGEVAEHRSHLLDSVQESQRLSALGNLMKDSNKEKYEMNAYKANVKNNVANTSYCLPVSLALSLSGITEKKV